MGRESAWPRRAEHAPESGGPIAVAARAPTFRRWLARDAPVTLCCVEAGREDAELVAEMARGSREALAELYDRYAAHLLAVARRMLRDRAEAEDLLHDVFLEAWRQASGYDGARGTVRAWLLIRLRARTLDRLRLRKLLDPTATMPTSIAPPVEPETATVRGAIAALPAEQRRAIELAYYQGLSATEIASAERAPLGTVKSRISAAMSKLRVALGAGAAPGGAQ